MSSICLLKQSKSYTLYNTLIYEHLWLTSMINIISVSTVHSDTDLMKSLKEYGFITTDYQHQMAVVLPECPVRQGALLKANHKPWMYFTTVVKLRRHYMRVYRDHSDTTWVHSENAKQVTLAINVLGALAYHMAEKIVVLLAKPKKKGALAHVLTPELMLYVSKLSYSSDPLDTCLKITGMCNEIYGVRFIRCVDALVNNHLGVYAKFSTVT